MRPIRVGTTMGVPVRSLPLVGVGEMATISQTRQPVGKLVEDRRAIRMLVAVVLQTFISRMGIRSERQTEE